MKSIRTDSWLHVVCNSMYHVLVLFCSKIVSSYVAFAGEKKNIGEIMLAG